MTGTFLPPNYTGSVDEKRLVPARAVLWILVAALLVTIVTLSLIPANQASSLVVSTHVPAVAAGARIGAGVQDAVWHSLFYAPFTLTLLLAAAWRPGLPRRRSRRAALLVVLVVGGVGMILEIVQTVWFDRSAELVDVVGNVVGVSLGAAVWRGIERACAAPLESLGR